MNWRNRLTLSAIAAVALVALPASAVGQQKSLKDRLVGTWQVVSWEQVRPDGSKFQRFGANPKGVHIFDATITALTADELKYENTTALSGGQIHIAFKRAPAAAKN
jgi:hypothetical protein